MNPPPLDWLLERIEVDPQTGCWIWQRYTDKKGYGRVNTRQFGGTQEGYGAYRLAWEIVNGPFPAGMDADHRCHNPTCANPHHIKPAPPSVNRSRQRHARSEQTHCLRGGHSLADAYTWGKRRKCRTCHREAAKRSRDKRR